MYLRKIKNYILICFFSLFFISCASGINETLNRVDETVNSFKITKKVETHKILHKSEVAPDIKLAVSALVMKMRHKTLRNRQVTFDKNGTHLIYESNFNYKGFKWDMLKISKYEVLSSNSNSSTFLLEGLITFSDKIGRTTSSLFAMEYRIKNNQYVYILESEIFDHYLTSTRVQTYFVPLNTLEKHISVLKSFDKLHAFAIKNAIRVRANKNEKLQYSQLSFIDKVKGNLPNDYIKGEFCALVFGMERFPNNSIFSIEIGDNTGQNYKGINIKPIYHEYNGWPLAIIGFNGEVRSFREVFTLNAYYQKKENSVKKHIASFNNSMDYGTYKITNGPFVKGEVLLNIKVRDNAKLIQSRLYELGYYKSAIDGDFGKKSKRALNNFVQDKLHYNFIYWTLNIQRELFKNTGL